MVVDDIFNEKGMAAINFNWKTLGSTYAVHYDQLNQRYCQIYYRSAESLLRLSSIRQGDTLIDLGAGTGISTAAARDLVGPKGRILAVDPSAEMLGKAREKPALGTVIFRLGVADDLIGLASEEGFCGLTDVVISNFTYYYIYQSRERLYNATHTVLKRGGRWSFNLTRYLGELKVGDDVHNNFSSVYMQHLRRIARRKGVSLGRPQNNNRSKQFRDTTWEIRKLIRAGFQDVRVEAWVVPIRPSEAYEFTIEGFFKHGARITFAPGLMRLPVADRIAILREALSDCKDAIDHAPKPRIANIVATKP